MTVLLILLWLQVGRRQRESHVYYMLKGAPYIIFGPHSSFK